MYTKLTIPERLKDLRVSDRHLTLQELSEQTKISKSALGKYESDGYKDISPFAIATLAEFYGVSTDYLMGLTENKNHPDTDISKLHLSDGMLELLASGRINNRLLCELATHKDFQRLMVDIEIYVDRIANMRIEEYNLVLEATRRIIMERYSPDENDLHLRTLEVSQVQEDEYFNYIVHNDIDCIMKDIQQEHSKDKTTADEMPTLEQVKKELEDSMDYASSDEAFVHQICNELDIPFEKLSSEEYTTLIGLLHKSPLLSTSQNMRGKKGNKKG